MLGPALKLAAIIAVMLCRGTVQAMVIGFLIATALGLVTYGGLFLRALKVQGLASHFSFANLTVSPRRLLRFSLPMLPEATVLCMPWVLWLSVAGIIYGALVALAQSDIKKLIAYSSVSHLGFCMLGIFALNRLGLQGGVLQMINHGLSTGGLFAIVGMIYERYRGR